MSTVREIEEVIPRLSRADIEALRDFIEDFLDDNLELNEDVAAKIDQSRREISAGQFTTRRPA